MFLNNMHTHIYTPERMVQPPNTLPYWGHTNYHTRVDYIILV